MTTPSAEPSRLLSLDQFRGYTVLGMFLVNFVGHFNIIKSDYPTLYHNNTYCSYHDTIMPQFFFAVGFAYRLTLLRRLQNDGHWAAYGRVLRRNLGLILLGFVIYHLDGRAATWSDLIKMSWTDWLLACKRDFFQTLTAIGVTSIWVLPVIATGPVVRVVFALVSAGAHLWLSYWFNYDWVHADPAGIDGGPLGFLTWTIPMLAGSVAYDVVAPGRDSPILPLLGWGCALMALGYGLSCLQLGTRASGANWSDITFDWAKAPLFYFVPKTPPTDIFVMSQRAGSTSYLIFATGFSLAIYASFVWACDRKGLYLPLLTTLGVNALAGYIIHQLVDDAIKPYAPKDSPLWFVLLSFGLFFSICYLFLRHLEKHRLYLRL